METLSRRKIVRRSLGIGCVTLLMIVVGALFLINQLASDWGSSTILRKAALSPDGDYVANITDTSWGIGGFTTLEVKPKKPSSLSVRFSRLFASAYHNNFAQVVDIQWTGKRTLLVQYALIPGGDGTHASSWGDVIFDYKPLPIH